MDREKAISAIKQLMSLVAARQFGLIYDLDYLKELSEQEIGEIIDSHPGKLSPTPAEVLENAYWFETLLPNCMRTDIDLYYDGERGDLTIGCSVFGLGDEEYRFAIEDIHVM